MKNQKAQVTIQYNYPKRDQDLVGVYSNTPLASIPDLIGDMLSRHHKGEINIQIITVKPKN